MTILIGDTLTAQINILDEAGDGITGLTLTTLASSDPMGDSFAVTYSELGAGAYFVQSDLPASMAGSYNLFAQSDDAETQEFSVVWTVGAESAVITGVQRVQYVQQPHYPYDADGTWDSRYYNKTEGEDAIEGALAGLATVTYVDTELATKADQAALDVLADDLAAVLIDTTDMATETWVNAAIAGKADTSYVDSEIATLGGALVIAVGAKVNDFTQYYTVVVPLGNGVDVIQSTEPAQYFQIPEQMNLVGAEVWGDVSGTIQIRTATAASESMSFTSIDAADFLGLAGVQTEDDFTLTGWTTAFSQWTKVRVTVHANATSVKACWVCYRFSKARG